MPDTPAVRSARRAYVTCSADGRCIKLVAPTLQSNRSFDEWLSGNAATVNSSLRDDIAAQLCDIFRAIFTGDGHIDRVAIKDSQVLRVARSLLHLNLPLTPASRIITASSLTIISSSAHPGLHNRECAEKRDIYCGLACQQASVRRTSAAIRILIEQARAAEHITDVSV